VIESEGKAMIGGNYNSRVCMRVCMRVCVFVCGCVCVGGGCVCVCVGACV
jgi:hypothetical protein